MELNSIAVVVRNLEQALRVCSNTLELKPPESGPYSKINVIDEPGFKMKFAFLQVGSWFLELVEPIEGPRVKTLEEKGEGAIYLLGFRVSNIEEWYDKLRKKGITPLDSRNSPLKEKKYSMTPTGVKVFFLPRDETSGIYIELLERPH